MLGEAPANLLELYEPLDRSDRSVEGMETIARSMNLELSDLELANACAWFLSNPHFGMQYLRELKQTRRRDAKG